MTQVETLEGALAAVSLVAALPVSVSVSAAKNLSSLAGETVPRSAKRSASFRSDESARSAVMTVAAVR
jgi:hypothetical protein